MLPFVFCFFLCAFFFSDFEPSVTTMAPKKTVPTKRHRSSFTSRAAPTPPDYPHHFISREVKRLYHESLCIRSFVPEWGFPTSNAFFNFTILAKPYVLPRPPEWPQSSASSTPTYHSGSAPQCLSEVSGLTSEPGPSTRFTS